MNIIENSIVRNGGEARPFPSSANLSDALGQLGYKFQTMHSRIRSVTGFSVWGPAYTIQCYAGATYAVEGAVESAAAGDVLVIGGDAFSGAVLMGGLMSERAKQRGIVGAVIDGAVRDVSELRKMEWPMFAASVIPRAGTFANLGQQQVPISCGDIVVRPGDWIAGDDDGVVVIPAECKEEILCAAWEIDKKEQFISQALKTGMSLADAAQEYAGTLK